MKAEYGRSLIEMLGVLTIGLIMTAAAYKTFAMLRTNQIRNFALSEMEQIARDTKTLLETGGDYTGVSIDYLIKSGAMTKSSAPIGGEDWSITAGIDGQTFAFNLTNISNSDCSYFATKRISWAESVVVNKIPNAGAESCVSGQRNYISIIVR